MVMVEVQDVHKSFGELHVLGGVSFEVGVGEVYIILGPFGSGKSTLLRCINALEETQAGSIRVNGMLMGRGQDAKGHLCELRPKELAAQHTPIGMAFQRFNLFLHMTALKNVVEAPIKVKEANKSKARTKASELLGRVGLTERANHYPAQLSGGQTRQVIIARALVMGPDLMLFGEPASALDSELVGKALVVMQDPAVSGMMMLVVTHEMDSARGVSDTVVFMDQGNIVGSSSPEDVLANPDNQRTRDFLDKALSHDP